MGGGVSFCHFRHISSDMESLRFNYGTKQNSLDYKGQAWNAVLKVKGNGESSMDGDVFVCFIFGKAPPATLGLRIKLNSKVGEKW